MNQISANTWIVFQPTLRELAGTSGSFNGAVRIAHRFWANTAYKLRPDDPIQVRRGVWRVNAEGVIFPARPEGDKGDVHVLIVKKSVMERNYPDYMDLLDQQGAERCTADAERAMLVDVRPRD